MIQGLDKTGSWRSKNGLQSGFFKAAEACKTQTWYNKSLISAYKMSDPSLSTGIQLSIIDVHVCSGAQPCLTVIPWTVAYKALLSMGLPWQEYWRTLQHFLLQSIFLTQGSNLSLLHWQADSLPLNHLEYYRYNCS